MTVPNDLLRRARLRTPSRWDPGECLSRQELVELVAAHVWELHGERAGLDDKYIGKLERGEIRWPGRRYREALRAVFGVDTDRELGFRPIVASRREDALLDDVDRRELIRHAAVLGGLALTAPTAAASALFEATAPALVPAHVGATEIDQVRTAARAVSAWSFAHGGEFALRAGEGHLRWATQLLTAHCPDRLSPGLNSAVSRLADACGFAAFDAHAFSQARRMLHAAYLCAEAGGNWALRASALTDTSLLALSLGRPDDALTYTHLALLRSGRLTPVERAMVWATRAWVHAQMGDTQATLTAIGTADDHFSNSRPGDETPLTYYTAVEHDGTCGRALYHLTRTTGIAASEAVDRQLSAIAGYGDEYARSRMHTQATLAVVVIMTRDPDEGAAIGLEALSAADHIRSARTREFFRALDDAAAKYSGRPVVDHLRERTAAFLPSDPPPIRPRTSP